MSVTSPTTGMWGAGSEGAAAAPDLSALARGTGLPVGSPNVVTLSTRIQTADVRQAEILDYLGTALAQATGAQVWLGIVTNRGAISHSACHVAPDMTKANPSKQMVHDALRECSISEENVFAGNSNMSSGGVSGIMENLRTECGATQIIGFSLSLPESHRKAAVLLAFLSPVGPERFFAILKGVSQEKNSLKQVLDAWMICQHGKKLSKLTRGVEAAMSRRGLVIGIFVAVLVACLAIPFPYTPTRESTLEPAHRSFVSAPIDGQLAKSFVRPGDAVVTDQLLAQMDGRQLERDLAAAMAELQAAEKKRDTAMATRASGDSQLAYLEQQQIQLKIDSLQARLSQLEIRSPADGVIVMGDWFGSDNASVTIGQTLFEVAPLVEMTSEIRLTAADLPEIREGCEVLLRAESQPGKTWRGKLSRIEPRAEVIDQKAYFIAEMDIDNPDGWLRPGMKATVRLYTGYRSIGWILFHQPYRWLMNQWVW